MPIFVICNLVAFFPWDWDNTKFLFFWFLAVCILVAALLVRAWREHGSLVVRGLLLAVVATMILSGVLLNFQQLIGKDRNGLLTHRGAARRRAGARADAAARRLRGGFATQPPGHGPGRAHRR